MNTTKQSFPELDDLRRRLEVEEQSLNYKLGEVRKRLDSVVTTLDLLKETRAADSEFIKALNTVYPNDLQGLTQLDALIKIASANKNRLKLTVAKDLLLRSGVTKSKKNANNIIFNVIKRSARFKRVGSGEYELLPETIAGSAPQAPLQ